MHWLYLIALAMFLAIDAVWLATVARTFYVSELGPLLRDQPNFFVAFAFYLIFVFGLVVFVIKPSIEANSFVRAVALGGLFGLVSYATYDLTNLATIKGFGMRVALVDLMWGTVLSAVVSSVTYLLAGYFGLRASIVS